MTAFRLIIPALWLIFIAYWAVSAVFAKRNVQTTPWWKLMASRIGALVLIVLSISSTNVRLLLRHAQATQADSLPLVASNAKASL